MELILFLTVERRNPLLAFSKRKIQKKYASAVHDDPILVLDVDKLNLHLRKCRDSMGLLDHWIGNSDISKDQFDSIVALFEDLTNAYLKYC